MQPAQWNYGGNGRHSERISSSSPHIQQQQQHSISLSQTPQQSRAVRCSKLPVTPVAAVNRVPKKNSYLALQRSVQKLATQNLQNLLLEESLIASNRKQKNEPISKRHQNLGSDNALARSSVSEMEVDIRLSELEQELSAVESAEQGWELVRMRVDETASFMKQLLGTVKQRGKDKQAFQQTIFSAGRDISVGSAEKLPPSLETSSSLTYLQVLGQLATLKRDLGVQLQASRSPSPPSLSLSLSPTLALQSSVALVPEAKPNEMGGWRRQDRVQDEGGSALFNPRLHDRSSRVAESMRRSVTETKEDDDVKKQFEDDEDGGGAVRLDRRQVLPNNSHSLLRVKLLAPTANKTATAATFAAADERTDEQNTSLALEFADLAWSRLHVSTEDEGREASEVE